MIPKANSVIGPDNQDMHEKIMRYVSSMDHRDYDFEEVDMTGIEHRHVAIKLIEKIFHEKEADLILTCEGPVDVYGYGETIPQQFGKAGMDITEGHGKFLLRAANMCQTTAISVPTDQLATGLVVIAKKGLEQSRYALHFARELEQRIKLPDVWRRYFLNEVQQIDRLTF